MSYEMPESEVRDRLDRIQAYNAYHLRAGQPFHCMQESQLRRLLDQWGFKPDRAKGIGYVPPPTEIMAKIRGTVSAGGEW